MPNTHLIIFDWDGTLMDSEAAIVAAMSEAYRREGEAVPSYRAIREIIGLSLSDAICRLTPAIKPDGGDRIAAYYRAGYAARKSSPALFPGVRETLSKLYDSGYCLAVATGKSRRGLAKAINDTDLGGLFVATRTADMSEPKPSPAMLHEILADLGVPAGAAIMIGDTDFDLAMAQAAGTQLAGVSYGAHPVERLLAYHPAFMLDDFGDLPNKMKTLN